MIFILFCIEFNTSLVMKGNSIFFSLIYHSCAFITAWHSIINFIFYSICKNSHKYILILDFDILEFVYLNISII